jgi:hypothetical protein
MRVFVFNGTGRLFHPERLYFFPKLYFVLEKFRFCVRGVYSLTEEKRLDFMFVILR